MGNVLTDKLTGQSIDIHAKSQTDLQSLFHAQKAELIAEITQAVANDFNNIMMAITGYAELELKKASAGDRRSLEHILSNAARATALVQKLLIVSRKHTPCCRPTDLNRVVSGMSDILAHLTAGKASISLDLNELATAVNADPSEIEEVILSLVIECRDTITGQGTIVITTKLGNGEEKLSSQGEATFSERHVVLSIAGEHADNSQHGSGRRVDCSQRGMQSKSANSLAALQEILSAAGASLECAGDLDGPASFTIQFPALEHTITSEQVERKSTRSVPLARTILIVDDDESVRIPAAEFLKMEGFKVLQANTGAEAINAALRSRSPLDVLVTDVVMPKMDGHVLAKKLLELNADLKVLYMSGDADLARMDELSDGSRMVTLRKPFRLDSLKDQIHELLGE